jgi:uncharacterized protein DUF4386
MRRTARIAGAFYVVTFVSGTIALVTRGAGIGAAAGMLAGASYIAVTLLFYVLFRPVNATVSLVAALVSLAGIAAGPLRLAINPLVFFGVYCLLIGYLIVRSTFLPRALGVLMACASIGWLTFLSPELGRSLYPYNLAPGILGEGALTLWLVAAGVNAPKWQEQAALRQARA